MAYGYRRAKSKISPVCRRKISSHIRKHRREGMERDQAVAAAYDEARRDGCKIPRYPGRYAHNRPDMSHDHEGKCCQCGQSHCCCSHPA